MKHYCNLLVSTQALVSYYPPSVSSNVFKNLWLKDGSVHIEYGSSFKANEDKSVPWKDFQLKLGIPMDLPAPALAGYDGVRDVAWLRFDGEAESEWMKRRDAGLEVVLIGSVTASGFLENPKRNQFKPSQSAE